MVALAILMASSAPTIGEVLAAPDVTTTEGMSRFFVSACLDGRASMPKGYKAVSATVAAMPRDKTLVNSRYYRLDANAPTFLRVSDVKGGPRGVTHFCELRAYRINVATAWPIVAGAIDPRIDAKPTKNIDLYEIDYPAQRYRVALMDRYLLVETFSEQAAAKRRQRLKEPDTPYVTRTNLTYQRP